MAQSCRMEINTTNGGLAMLRSWWKNTSKTLDAVVILMLVVLVALVVVIILGYANNWNWTGLHGRTLYDWLQLLIIPAVLAVGGYLFTYTTGRTEREAAEKRVQTERDIALDNQREATMKEYFDRLSELMLHENLLKSKPEAEVRKVARILTLTVLPRLDEGRKKSVLKFLYESELIAKGNMVVELAGADFSGVDLSGADLRNIVLHGAKLIGANLRYADLRDAVLIETIFREADLTGAKLIGAYLNLADLRNANLTGAQLNEANLEMVTLSGAKFTVEQLKKAKSLGGAGALDWLLK